MKRLVELHFERCLIALATRKEFLLRDLDDKVNDNRMIEHHSSYSDFLLKKFIWLFFLTNKFYFNRKTRSRSSNQVETID
jgi:hypothetical protein